MPCNDIRENLDIELNAENAILSYSLAKKTCGAKVGQHELLLNWARNKTSEEITNMQMADFLKDYSVFVNSDKIDKGQEFILLKHFEILKSAIHVVCGGESASIKDDIVIDFLEFDNNYTKARLIFNVGGINASENPGCGTSCSGGGCGSK